VRYIDAQAGDDWVVPVAVLAALLSNPATTEAAAEACLPVAGRWADAARLGLADPAIAKAAAAVFGLAIDALPSLVGPGPVRELVETFSQRWVLRGRCPADEVVPADPAPKGDSQ
jgi:glutamate--cysteine ligase